MGLLSSDNELFVLFPKKTQLWVIDQFLSTIYPESIIEIDRNTENKIETVFKLNFSLDPTIKIEFGLIFEQYWLKLVCLEKKMENELMKQWVVLCSQFHHNYIFDILKYTEENYYQNYFDAIKSILDKDFGSAGLNLGFIAEHFGKVVLKEIIPDSYKGMRGVTKIREFVKNHDSWNDLINVIPKIKKMLNLEDIEKENLELLQQGFHFLRLLRNKAVHPNPTFTYSHSVAMLSLLIFLPGLLEWILEF